MPNAEGVRLEKFQSNPIDWGSRHGGVTAPGTQMNQLGLRGRSCRASSILNHSNTILVEDLEDPVVLIVASSAYLRCPHVAPIQKTQGI